MIKLYKHFRVVTLMIVLVPGISIAQNQDDISIFLKATSKDAGKLISAYMQPTIKSLSYGMTGNWFTTGATHKPLGIDLSISGNLAFIPASDDYFNPNKLKLSSTTTYNGNADHPSKGAPTFFGPKDRTSYSATYDPDGAGPLPAQTMTFDGPEGLAVKEKIGFAGIPVPVVQLGIGIIKNTDLKFRFIPEVKAGGSSVKMFGIGIQHDIKQHIKGIKLLPFDLSVLIAYNSLTGSTDLRNSDATDSRPDSDDGESVYKFKSWVFQALISKKLSVVTFYGGPGYSIINTDVNVNGTYMIESDGGAQFETDKNPVALSIKNSSLRFTAGMRLKFGPVYLNGDYTLQKYKLLTVGLGFTVR